MEPELNLMSRVEKLYHDALLYANQSKDLFILNAIDKASRSMAEAVSSIVIFIFIHLTVLFASISIGWYLGLWLENMPLGFFTVALFYLIVLIVAVALNKNFMQPRFIDFFIKKFADDYATK
ncbi:MAG: hypothetical protein ACKVOU_06260 [Cytophagales bacterium]